MVLPFAVIWDEVSKYRTQSLKSQPLVSISDFFEEVLCFTDHFGHRSRGTSHSVE